MITKDQYIIVVEAMIKDLSESDFVHQCGATAIQELSRYTEDLADTMIYTIEYFEGLNNA